MRLFVYQTTNIYKIIRYLLGLNIKHGLTYLSTLRRIVGVKYINSYKNHFPAFGKATLNTFYISDTYNTIKTLIFRDSSVTSGLLLWTPGYLGFSFCLFSLFFLYFLFFQNVLFFLKKF